MSALTPPSTLAPPTEHPRPVLHVCTTCRRGGPAMENPPGAQLYAQLLALRAQEQTHPDAPPEQALIGVDIQPVECLAACNQGCTAAIAMPGRWTWLLGHLGPEKAQDLLTYARLYAGSKKGTVMPSRRPASLSNMVLGRVPAVLYPVPISQEQDEKP
ncbi:DUF1636 family protein [Acetobacter orientalis]|uniref:DUF1636 domain-containing protein n=1 Tax=Acetobacter orientalis TaxID=146474 RepID=A0A2Z5ZLM5_9PROT|nr:DUF1636 domain-containing protein [Acetobacter orientalis]BBC80937.1 DUF1636 domain-containing protein [Acetobacter orientalis]GAN64753.1 hypothetical protein Abor_001_035 [Acetobacter orientalis]GEL62108.1 metal-binding protein [Acetobacter orientalis]